MEMDYQKKDIQKAPKVKKVAKPEHNLFEKRGSWHIIMADGEHKIFQTKEEANAWLNK